MTQFFHKYAKQIAFAVLFTGPLIVSCFAGAPTYTGSDDKTRHLGIDSLPPETFGERTVVFDYTGVRHFPQVPAIGVHPRVFFGPDEIADIKNRLATTEAGKAVTNEMDIYSGFLRVGVSYYKSLPEAERKFPDGVENIPNTGYWDQSAYYKKLVEGDTTAMASMSAQQISATAGEMSVEAFECLIHKGEPDYDQRAKDLAAAMDTWAQSVLAQTKPTEGQFGGAQMALAYDFNFGAMTADQRTHVRHLIALGLPHPGEEYFSARVAPEASIGNWITLHSHTLIQVCAVEGETTVEQDGVSSEFLKDYFRGAMAAQYKFFTYGIYPNGAPYEGLGKNELAAAHAVMFAKRGYDFFGHPSIRKFMHTYAQAMMQPFGYAYTTYDVLGGSGPDPVVGGHGLHANDVVGLKWAFPDDAAADFLWRNGQGVFKDGQGVAQPFYDYRADKYSINNYYWDDLIPAAIFALDFTPGDWSKQNAAVQPGLDYEDLSGGTIESRSSFEPDAVQFISHIRQDFGGHTTADRNGFSLSGLGRIWVRVNSGFEPQESKFQSVVLVDDTAMQVTNEGGRKMRIPAKLAAWKSTPDAHFCTGDATYAYTNKWVWRTDGKLSDGFVPETITLNDFLAPPNKIIEKFGHTPLNVFPYMFEPNLPEGIQKEAYNPMAQVYRTAGLIRGEKPYALVIDDIRKDGAPHDYKWLAQIPEDLSILVGDKLPQGFDPATDVLLQEPAATGDRQLLVRILHANGTPVQEPAAAGSTLAYVVKDHDPRSTARVWPRLVIERASVVSPDFRVLLFPMHAGDPVPATKWNEKGDLLTIAIGHQADTFQFYPRAAKVGNTDVTMSEFTLSRDNNLLMDYRNLIEPMPLR